MGDRLLSPGSPLEPHYDNDKRNNARLRVLDYAVVQGDALDATFNAVVVDIGLGGLQLHSRQPLNLGERFDVRVGIAAGPPVLIPCEVRHSAPIGQTGLYATGVRFVPEDHEERTAVAEFVHGAFQRQRDTLDA